MDYKFILFTLVVWSAGLWFIFDSWQDWKKGETAVRFYPFFGRRRWVSVYRHDEPIIFRLIILVRLVPVLVVMVTVLWYTTRWYLYERL